MTSPKLASVDIHTAFFSSEPTVVSFVRATEVVLCARSSSTRAAGVVMLRNPDARELGPFISQVGQGGKTQDLSVKVIGNADQVQAAEGALKRLGVLHVKSYVAQTSKVEGYYYSDTARMRVSEVGRGLRKILTEGTAKVDVPVRDKRKQRVLIVDDSKTIRQVLRRILSASPQLEVVGEAERPSQVSELIKTLKPDVMTLDINMPEMTGVDLLQKLFPNQFVPTVMISSVSLTEGHEVMKALELGAVDYIQKPEFNEIEALAPTIQSTVYHAAFSRSRQQRKMTAETATKVEALDTSRFLAIGASTGGTEAIRALFQQLPKDCPPIGVVQHIPPYFSTAFAQRLNELCAFEVREAKDGDVFQKGLALIAPGGLHMEVLVSGGIYRARIYDGQPVNRFKPSVDVFFNSVAAQLGRTATGVLLTGMGDDGARGMLKMKQAGALTIAESEESCVVFGMPRAAIELGAAEKVARLEQIAHHLPMPLQYKKTS